MKVHRQRRGQTVERARTRRREPFIPRSPLLNRNLCHPRNRKRRRRRRYFRRRRRSVPFFLPSVLSLPLLLRRVRGDAVLIGRDDGRALSLSHTHVRPFLPSFFLQLRGSKERPKEHARVRTHATTRGPSSRAPARQRACLQVELTAYHFVQRCRKKNFH